MMPSSPFVVGLHVRFSGQRGAHADATAELAPGCAFRERPTASRCETAVRQPHWTFYNSSKTARTIFLQGFRKALQMQQSVRNFENVSLNSWGVSWSDPFAGGATGRLWYGGGNTRMADYFMRHIGELLALPFLQAIGSQEPQGVRLILLFPCQWLWQSAECNPHRHDFTTILMRTYLSQWGLVLRPRE